MRQICNGPDPVVVKGAIQSLPSTVWWRFHIDRAEICEISNDLFEAFLHFTRHRGWDKFLKVWLAEVRYTGHPYPVAGVTKGGLLRLFALVLEYAVDKDSEERVDRLHPRVLQTFIASKMLRSWSAGCGKHPIATTFRSSRFFYLGLHDSNIDI
ncbi:hypothetical protein FA13DRAFT_327733 [Coprinellus micaceus]|uniref:Uncharacterized protein n=1 Tax=Coprinellus micaceus TaxID=71717 RepID=A0A4Y7SDV8_COPMI|nr:hypothetical protein FA13DRAFT_327733 [Coprinellus micaceus]